jgi:hypothetical protein
MIKVFFSPNFIPLLNVFWVWITLPNILPLSLGFIFGSNKLKILFAFNFPIPTKSNLYTTLLTQYTPSLHLFVLNLCKLKNKNEKLTKTTHDGLDIKLHCNPRGNQFFGESILLLNTMSAVHNSTLQLFKIWTSLCSSFNWL